MFDDTQSLLEFIELAKEAKIKSFQIGDIKVEFSDLAFLDSLQPEAILGQPTQTEEKNTSKTLVDTLQTEDEDDLLFWSTKA